MIGVTNLTPTVEAGNDAYFNTGRMQLAFWHATVLGKPDRAISTGIGVGACGMGIGDIGDIDVVPHRQVIAIPNDSP